MGYAGYAPGFRAPDKPSDKQAALWRVGRTESLDVIAKLLQNAAVDPKEEKFRRVRLSNAKIRSLIVEEPGALDALRALGWAADPQDGESLVIPAGRYFSMADVRLVQEAGERLRKLQRDAKRSTAAAKVPGSSEQAKVRAQLEADRAERASRAARAAE